MTANSDASSRSSAPQASRVPLSIQIISLAFCLIGALLVAAAIEQLLNRGAVRFTFAFFGALAAMLTAYGLLRLHNAARILVLVQTWFWLFLSPLPIIALAIRLATNSTDLVSLSWQLSALLGSFVYSVWQCRLLHSRRMRELFATSSRAGPMRFGTSPAGRFRFGLKTALLVTLLFAVVFARLSVSLYAPRATSIAIIQSDGSSVQVDYGYRSHRLLNVAERLNYVVFHDTRDVFVAVPHGPGGIESVHLVKPDGTFVDLPNEIQLYECIDGNYRESRHRVEKWQFDAWLASNPAEYSIDALLEYAKSHPTEEQ